MHRTAPQNKELSFPQMSIVPRFRDTTLESKREHEYLGRVNVNALRPNQELLLTATFLRPELELSIINNDYYDDSNDNIKTIYPERLHSPVFSISKLALPTNTQNQKEAWKLTLILFPLPPLLHGSTQLLVLAFRSTPWIHWLAKVLPSFWTLPFNNLLADCSFPLSCLPEI